MIVIKKEGNKQKFSEKKVFDSVKKACLIAQLDNKACREIPSQVTKLVKAKIKGSKTIKSDLLFKYCIELLKKIDDDVAFIYETHRDLS